MTEKYNEEHHQELKQMIKDRKPGQSVEQVLSVFCQRHGLSFSECQVYYDRLVKSGEIKEK